MAASVGIQAEGEGEARVDNEDPVGMVLLGPDRLIALHHADAIDRRVKHGCIGDLAEQSDPADKGNDGRILVGVGAAEFAFLP